MLLTITTTHVPATDLGYLLHKNPTRFQSFSLGFGQAHIFYSEANSERCTAALLLDVDPIGLVRSRGRPGGPGGEMEQYVNDRPYVASSHLSVAIARVLGSALAGRCNDRPDLVKKDIPLEATLAAVPSREGPGLLRSLFEPLGYEVDLAAHPLDERFPQWGDAPYFTVHLRAKCTLQALLEHLYVLVPVLDQAKHYWVGEDEVAKLLRRGNNWLPDHPQRELITRRYLKHQRSLVYQALERLVPTDSGASEEGRADGPAPTGHEEELEAPLGLGHQRVEFVIEVLHAARARRVLDLGCGEGRLLRELLKERSFSQIVGVDVSHRALERAQERLRLDMLPPRERERVQLWQGSLTYRDSRLEGFDAAVLMEVVEHIEPGRLVALAQAVFGSARPGTVIVTTPNVEYNGRFPRLASGAFRHPDHRFEWTSTCWLK
jgi:3' terminal RNA ribose 2'-O-methyltransferase Hen1